MTLFNRYDYLILSVPYMIGLVISFTLYKLGLLHGSPFPLVMFIVYPLIDIPHVFASLFFAATSPKLKKNIWVKLSPIIVIGVLAIIYYGFGQLRVIQFVLYFNIYHILQQQFIYLKWLQKGESKVKQLISKLFLITGLSYPIIWWHTHSPRNFGLSLDVDPLVTWIPSYAEDVSFVLFIISSVIYIIYSLVQGLSQKQLVLMLSSIISFGSCIMLFNSLMSFLLIGIFLHSGTYLFWIYSKHKSYDIKMFMFKKWYIFYGILAVIGLIVSNLKSLFIENSKGFYIFFDHVRLDDPLITIVIVIALTPQLIHYFLDLFIWKKILR